MKNELIARCVHHVNNKICELNNEQTIAWEDTPKHMQDGLISAINDNLSPREGHINWMMNRLANGWKLGAEKSIENKISPCLIPYEELPYAQRIKDSVRQGIVEFLKEVQE